MVTYIALAIKDKDMERPYKSPLGLPGAWVGVTISVIALVATFALKDNQPGVIGAAIFVGVLFMYYWFHSRHQLVAQSPEEAIALLMEAEKEVI